MTGDALFREAAAHYRAGRADEAEKSCATLLRLEPGHAGAGQMMGFLLLARGRAGEALPYLAAALARQEDAVTLVNHGMALFALERNGEALASFDRAAGLGADMFALHFNRGLALKGLGRSAEALAAFAEAQARDPAHAGAFYHQGTIEAADGKLTEALASYDRTIALEPGFADAYAARAALLLQARRKREALEDFDRALALAPDHLGARLGRGSLLAETGWMTRALGDFDAALAQQPGHPVALGNAFAASLHLCDWERAAALAPLVEQAVADGRHGVPVFSLMGWRDDPALLARAGENAVKAGLAAPPAKLPPAAPYRHRRIRIAYLSSDFRQHATSVLLAPLIERHDRARFEIIGISLGLADDSAIGRRIVSAFDRFEDWHQESQPEVARRLRALEVDIAVDVNGHTRDCFPAIFFGRPAPVQVNYLAFPGTIGADFMDYIIADRIVLPFAEQPHFHEKIVQLPDCYQVNDPARSPAPAPSRAEAGLPEQGFVFACFNTSWKITPPIFEIWMRLLEAVPGSVLWLMENYAEASVRLRAEAASRGIDPARLVFARLLPMAQHLARHALADLFLDTLPYNAHTTGSDALWAGLPLLTCTGASFASRVGASLLTAAGLPELITHTLADYEALALALARDPARLAGLKARLAANRGDCALFDAGRYARGIEAAYIHMWERAEAGASPEAFAVADLPGWSGA